MRRKSIVKDEAELITTEKQSRAEEARVRAWAWED